MVTGALMTTETGGLTTGEWMIEPETAAETAAAVLTSCDLARVRSH
eukprot:CAMPEP_0115092864 /NCGR_PEP_ID=MMETSP0227-20121206/27078_1 /TAXON_ID=89957 /ORGANISM="Polarella glacialis, Strain CCMP 1383" /LENGTH=45 /DNA_ID= /DNA_START= /DNA_END= /DNA_ORIENTATION=